MSRSATWCPACNPRPLARIVAPCSSFRRYICFHSIKSGRPTRAYVDFGFRKSIGSDDCIFSFHAAAFGFSAECQKVSRCHSARQKALIPLTKMWFSHMQGSWGQVLRFVHPKDIYRLAAPTVGHVDVKRAFIPCHPPLGLLLFGLPVQPDHHEPFSNLVSCM